MLRKLALTLIAIGLYIVAYAIIFPYVGLPGALLVFPTLVAGWMLGWWRGTLAGAVIGVLTVMLSVISYGSWDRIRETWLGLVIGTVLGGVVGWFRDLYDRWREQARQLEAARAELSRLNAELEQRVQTRTLELTDANRKLRELNETLETLINSSPTAIVVTDPQGIILRINPAVTRVFGWAEADLLGKSVAEFDSPGGEGILPRMGAGLEQHGLLHNLEMRRHTRAGQLLDVSISVAPIHNSEGAVTGYISLVSDITARKRAEAEVHRLNADLERRVAERTEQLTAANAQLEAFGTMVAHDLRNPLTTVQSYNDVLMMHYAGQPLDAQAQELLAQMQESTERMAQLIQDLFDFSRSSQGELRRGPVDLAGVAQAVAAELQAREPDRQVEFQIARSLVAEADTRYMRVLFDNLLSNAWKYTSHRPLAQIEVGQAEVNGSRAYFVRDNGAGFDMANAAQLFQPFRRFHDHDDFSGVGLGLATCKRIVERHDGRIWVKSEVGEGATFYFTLGE